MGGTGGGIALHAWFAALKGCWVVVWKVSSLSGKVFGCGVRGMERSLQSFKMTCMGLAVTRGLLRLGSARHRCAVQESIWALACGFLRQRRRWHDQW